MARQVRIVIDKRTGRVTVDFSGFVGAACHEEREKIARLLRERFGIELEVEEIVEKPEVYEEHVQEVTGW